jgi:replicative DNA helicase
MGKTGFAINVGLSAAEAGKRVYFASLEMSSDQIGERLLAIKLRIPMIHLRRGVGIADRMPGLLAERQRCANLPLMIDESSALTVAQLMTRVRRSHRKRPLDLVQIDYLQLLHGTSYRGSNRTQEVAEISGALKALAMELGVPVMALSQLNRGTETRSDKRPHLADLRDSGAIEQDADIVAFVHRPAYYLEREQPSPLDAQAMRTWQRELDAVRGKAEIIIAKHRHGPTGIVELDVDEQAMKFRSRVEGRS